MRKIIIIGLSGAGKTTLARELSKKLDIPHTELDSFYHQENWQPLDRDEFFNRVQKITDGDKWILCGNYFSTLGLATWQKADTIVWCDYPFSLVLRRLLKRTLRRTLTYEELWNGSRERFFVNFFTRNSVIIWMLQQWRKQKNRYSTLFHQPPKELKNVTLVRLHNPTEATNFVHTAE